MSTHQRQGAQGAVEPYREFDRLLAAARGAGLRLTDDDVGLFCADGPTEATARLRGIMQVHGIGETEPPLPPATPAQQQPKRGRPLTGTRPGPVNAPGAYTMTEGFYKMPNTFADELLAVMPGPVLKAYVYAHRLARIDGTFWISYGTVAHKIGCRSQRHGRRVFGRLREAGLVRLLNRGSDETRKANVYQLVPLDSLNLDSVRRTLDKPLTSKKSPAGIGAASVRD